MSTDQCPGGTANILPITQVDASAKIDTPVGTPTQSSNDLDSGTRVPDDIVQPQTGVMYSLGAAKIAEHSGGSYDDPSLALLVVDGRISSHTTTIRANISSTQVAPAIRNWPGLNPDWLASVQEAEMAALPATSHSRRSYGAQHPPRAPYAGVSQRRVRRRPTRAGAIGEIPELRPGNHAKWTHLAWR